MRKSQRWWPRGLVPKSKKTKQSKLTGNSSTTAKNYDVTNDDNDEESVMNSYGDQYINKEATFDVPISELQNVIVQKKKEEEGFKKEYAVSKPTRRQELHNNNVSIQRQLLSTDDASKP